MLKKWQSIALWKRVLVGLFLGLAVGLLLRYSLGGTEGSSTLEVSVEAGQVGPVTLSELGGMGDKRIIDPNSFKASHGKVAQENDSFQ